MPNVCLVPVTAVRLNFEVTVTDRKSGSPATVESFVLLKLNFGYLSIKALSLRSLIYIWSSVWIWTEMSYAFVIAFTFTANFCNSAEVQRTVLMQVVLYQVKYECVCVGVRGEDYVQDYEI